MYIVDTVTSCVGGSALCFQNKDEEKDKEENEKEALNSVVSGMTAFSQSFGLVNFL